MISSEPTIAVGILDYQPVVRGTFLGRFTVDGHEIPGGPFEIWADGSALRAVIGSQEFRDGSSVLRFSPLEGARFLLHDVTIGVAFHWERKEKQTFEGDLRCVLRPGKGMAVINDIALERYLKSVISSEMSASCPGELLRAHAVTSRSWLVAMLERGSGQNSVPLSVPAVTPAEIVRWYTREDHDLFDVCADDHCQRYQGVTTIVAHAVDAAVDSTRGLFLVHDENVCDARFYKACGGITEEFQNAWEDVRIPYLRSVSDAARPFRPVTTEEEARQWLLNAPDAYCNTSNPDLLQRILPGFDQETKDFFRWTVRYERSELGELIRRKSGVDIGDPVDLVPLQRGPSGRIVRLRLVGSRHTITIGKELEIRRWLSPSHLYSSAFVVEVELNKSGAPSAFVLHGGGWGHGVGLCQIGAAVMAEKGEAAATIIAHYFPGASLQRLY